MRSFLLQSILSFGGSSKKASALAKLNAGHSVARWWKVSSAVLQKEQPGSSSSKHRLNI